MSLFTVLVVLFLLIIAHGALRTVFAFALMASRLSRCPLDHHVVLLFTVVLHAAVAQKAVRRYCCRIDRPNFRPQFLARPAVIGSGRTTLPALACDTSFIVYPLAAWINYSEMLLLTPPSLDELLCLFNIRLILVCVAPVAVYKLRRSSLTIPDPF